MQHHEHLTGSKDIKFRLSREYRFNWKKKCSIASMKKEFFVVYIIVVGIARFFFLSEQPFKYMMI